MLRVDFIDDEGVVIFKMDIDSDVSAIAVAKMAKEIMCHTSVELIIIDGIEVQVSSNYAVTSVEVAKAWMFCTNTKRMLLKAAEDGTLGSKLNRMYEQDRI